MENAGDMNKENKFRVLIVDDSKKVIEVAETLVGKTARFGYDRDITVVTECVHVTLAEEPGEDDKPRLSTKCLEDLAKKVKVKPDLILLDYGFAHADIGRKMVSVSRDGTCDKTTRDEITKGLLRASDVKKHLAGRTELTDDQKKPLRDNFFDSGVPVYLYTFRGPEALQDVIGDVDVRHEPIKQAFPKSKVITIDTQNELYGGGKFDERREDEGYENKYYHAYLTARLLDWIVVKELGKFEVRLEEREKCKQTIEKKEEECKQQIEKKKKEIAEMEKDRKKKKMSKAVGAGIGFVSGTVLSIIADMVIHFPSSQDLTVASCFIVMIVFLVGFDYMLKDDDQ